MEGDKPEMKSESDVKEKSSPSGENRSKLADENEGNAGEKQENYPAREQSQPFFVADTLEDDSLIIPPTQEDSVPFLIPSTPCLEKSDKRQPDPNDSTISILEETYVDFDTKAEHNSSKENEHEQTCNESDMTQDLELDATQPIIPSVDVQKEADKKPETDQKNEEEEEDDEWQLKFSETQTQDVLLQYNKENEEDKPEIEKPVAEVSTKSEVSVPEALTMSIEESPKKDAKCSFNDSSVKLIEANESNDMETQSDDEIEPSQSCLSEYKGETISTSFKMQSSTEPPPVEASVEEIPNLETESNAAENNKNGEKINDILEENEQDITTISDDDSSFHAKNFEKSDTISVIPVDDTQNFDNVIVRDTDELNEPEDVKAEPVKLDEEKTVMVSKSPVKLSENVCEEVMEVQESEECVKDYKESTQFPRNEVEEVMEFMKREYIKDINDSAQFPKNECDEVVEFMKKEYVKEIKDSIKLPENECENAAEAIQDSEESVREIKLRKEIIVETTEVEKSKDFQVPQEKTVEVRNGDKIPEIKLTKNKVDEENTEHPESSNISIIVIGDSENDGKTMKDDSKIERMDSNKRDKDKISNVGKVNEKGELSTDVKTGEAEKRKDSLPSLVKKMSSETDLKMDESSKIEYLPTKPESESVDSETDKSSDISQEKGNLSANKTETPPTSMLPPKSAKKGYGLLRKQKIENKNVFQDSSPSDRSEKNSSGIPRLLGSYESLESLEKWLKSVGITLSSQVMEKILKTSDDVEIKPVYIFSDQKIRLKACTVEFDNHRVNTGISPASSIRSGEMADISSSLSSKSVNSCGIQVDSVGQSLNFLSSQESPKTSTQKTQEPTGFSAVFGKKEPSEKSETDISPIPSNKTARSAPQKRKRGKKVSESSSTETSAAEHKRKRGGRAAKTKAVIEEKSEETEETNELTSNATSDVKPRKATRRKVGTEILPHIKPEEFKIVAEKFEMLTDDDYSTATDEGNFGSILPGVKVMARWKDGYYYSGMVESQESDGKWAVLFEDGFLRTIIPENLIKIAILPKGTSVLVQSPDDFYDPGIVCGHFREGNKVGYEVELDNGVTRRYSRSSVILSGDQAKLISRPETTPPSTTINLDNIVPGKRKRKSIQSPMADPVVKKSPRITRSKKPDSNLDSTAESSATEVAPVVQAKDSKTTEAEEPAKKKRKAARRAPAKSNISAETSSSSNNKKTKKLPQRKPKNGGCDNTCKTVKGLRNRSAKGNSKLFKDYAFLLTNADRKIIPKTDASDSENKSEEDDIVPFDKDELCGHIAAGGGLILDKFDDIKKCNRKYIYLLANSFLRTMKYIQCLAAGISCIKHHWVQNCIFKSEILDLKSYILPSGYSLVKQQIIEWHGITDVFKNLKIALVSAPESPFVYTWAPVLLAAKADFVQKWNLPTSVSGCSLVVDVLITNNHCPVDIIQSAKKRKIPIVSSEWIIQCLIIGKRLPYDAHPKFKYDFIEI